MPPLPAKNATTVAGARTAIRSRSLKPSSRIKSARIKSARNKIARTKTKTKVRKAPRVRRPSRRLRRPTRPPVTPPMQRPTPPPRKKLICRSEYVEEGYSEPDTCETQPGGKCYSLVQDFVDADTGRLEVERIYGCMAPEEDSFLFECGSNKSHHGKSIVCCDSGDMCNQDIEPAYSERTEMLPPPLPPLRTLDPLQRYIGISISVPVIVTSGVLLALLLIVLIVYGLWSRCRCCCCCEAVKRADDGGTDTADVILTTDPDAPKLVQRRIHKEITLQQPIGCGRFADVWRGQFHGQSVAIKVFRPEAEAICLREVDVFKLMRHENVQHYIGSDVAPDGLRILVTPYYELRTVHSFLAYARAPLQSAQLCQLAYTLAAGLDYLHTEIGGVSGKPSIAHGDLNARNVLVRRNMECVLTDFGLAVKNVPDSDAIEMPATAEPSDWRYVAPERLSDMFVGEQTSFGAHMMADMYAAGSVWWQMTRCCATKHTNEAGSADEATEHVPSPPADALVCEGYELPFAAELQSVEKPTLEAVKHLVCDAGSRPQLPARWRTSGDEVMRTMRVIVIDCWKENAAARLTALRVKKTLGKLRENPAVYELIRIRSEEP